MKAALGAQVGLSEADSKKLTDQEILTQFYTGENLLNVSDGPITICLCVDMCASSPSGRRRKRSTGGRVAVRVVRAVETEEEVAVRSFGSVLRYQCGLARRFLDQETEMHYDIREMECHWNQVTLLFYPQGKFQVNQNLEP